MSLFLRLFIILTTVAISFGCSQKELEGGVELDSEEDVLDPDDDDADGVVATAIRASGSTAAYVDECLVLAVQLVDADGDLATASGATVVSFANLSNAQIYGTSVCLTPTMSATIAQGDSSTNVYYKNSSAEVVTFDLDDSGALTDDTHVVTTTALPSQALASLEILGANQINAAQCATFTVRTLDTLNVVRPVGSNLTINLTTDMGGTFYSDSGCSTSATTATILSGSSSATFYFQNSTAESLNISADDGAALIDDSHFVNVKSLAPTVVTILGAATANVDQCITLVAEIKDAQGNYSALTSAKTFTYGALSNAKIYSDAACSNEVSSSLIASGNSSFSFYFKNSSAEAVTFSIDDGGALTDDTHLVTTSLSIAQQPTVLEITGPSSVNQSACSQAYTVKSKDSNGVVRAVTADTVVNLTGGGGGVFYSASNCTGVITSVTILEDTSQAQFYFRDNSAENLTFSADDVGALTAGTHAVTVISSGGGPTPTVGFLISSAQVSESSSSFTVTIAISQTSSNTITVPYTVTGTASYPSDHNQPASGTFTVQPSSLYGTQSFNIYNDSTAEANETLVFTLGTPTNASAGAITTFTANILDNDTSGSFGEITKVSAGNTHACFIQNGAAKCFGGNDVGQLGNGTTTRSFAPVQVTGLTSGVTDISSSNITGATCVVHNGAAKCWGEGQHYQLGNGATSDSTTPVQVTGLTTGVTQVSVGGYHTCAIHNDRVKCWGSQNEATNTGALGDGNSTGYSTTPAAVIGTLASLTATKIASGESGSCALANAKAYCWGYSLGSSSSDISSPELSPWGQSYSTASATDIHFAGLVAFYQINTSLSKYGSNNSSYNSLPTKGVQKVAGASIRTYCAIINNEVICNAPKFWYAHGTGQPGSRSSTPVSDFEKVRGLGRGVFDIAIGGASGGTGGTFGCAVYLGRLKCWGLLNSMYFPIATDIGSTATEVAPDATVTVIRDTSPHCVLTNGAVYCKGGNNTYGQLGDGTNQAMHYSFANPVIGLESGVTSLSMSNYHGCAVQNGAVKCWGNGGTGELGDGLSTTSYIPVQVSGITSGATKVAVGESFSCAIHNGAAKCWGLTARLGNGGGGSSVPVQVTGLTSGVTEITASRYHTCAIHSGVAKCWGEGSVGQMGNGVASDCAAPCNVTGWTTGVEAISAGYEHTCGIRSGAAYCWGKGTDQQIGDGAGTQRNSPTAVTGLGSLVTEISASAYDTYSCAIHSGAVKCWGTDTGQATGSGSAVATATTITNMASGASNLHAGTNSACAVKASELYCWGSAISPFATGTSAQITTLMVTYSSPFNTLSGYVQKVSSGANHSCAIVSEKAFCWGNNQYGQLGDNTTTSQSEPIEVTGLTSGVTDISAGDQFSCAVQNGATKCWGLNNYGQLGDGTTTNRLTPTQVSGLTTETSAITTGTSHACATYKNKLQCWGINNLGQLGDGTTTDRLSPVDVTFSSTSVFPDGFLGSSTTHTCSGLIHNSGSSDHACWGENNYGQLTLGYTSSPMTTPQISSSTTANFSLGSGFTTYFTGSAIRAVGKNNYGQLGNNSTTSTATAVNAVNNDGTLSAAGSDFACHVLSVGEVQCYGRGDLGQLGDGRGVSSVEPVTVQGPGSFQQLDGGSSHICGVQDGLAYCWGYNSDGQLGVGNTNNSFVPIGITFP